MFCKDCGAMVPDGNKFCNRCGSPVETESPVTREIPTPEPPVAEEVPDTPAAPVAEEVPVTEHPAPEPPAPEVPAAVAVADFPQGVEAPVPAKGKKKAGKIVAITALCVVLVALAATGAVLLGRVFLGGGGEGRVPVYAYTTGDGELMVLPNLKEKTKALEATDEWQRNDRGNSLAQFSKDGKYVYFTSAAEKDALHMDLYRAPVSGLKKGESADRVVRDVDYFRVLDGGQVVFWCYDEDWNASMGLYDGEEDDILAKEPGDWYIPDDGKSLFYTVPEGNGQTLIRYDLNSGEEEELVEGAYRFLSALNAETLVYLVDQKAGWDGPVEVTENENHYTIYSLAPGQEPQELAKDVNGNGKVMETREGQLQLDYSTTQTWGTTLYDYVNDPGDADLANVTEPNYSAYDLYAVYLVDGQWYYENWDTSMHHPLDVTPLLTGGQTPDDLWNYEVEDYARQMLSQQYDAAYAAWEAVSQREYLRESLRYQDYTVRTYDIYSYHDGAAQLVAGDVTDHAGQDGVYVYQKAPSQGKVMDIADLDPYNYYDQITEKLGPGQWYQNINGVESPIDLDGDVFVQELYTLNGKDVILSTSDGLRFYTIQGDSLKLVEKQAGYGSVALTEKDGQEQAYYLVDQTLGIFRDGKCEKLADDVRGVWYTGDGATCYAITGKDDADQGTLFRFQNGTTTTITDELSLTTSAGEPFAPCGEEVLYIAGNGRLYVWEEGKEPRRLAKDATSVWANSPESFYRLWN